MGLDMYLMKANRKINTQQELDDILQNEYMQSMLNDYNYFIDDIKKSNGIKNYVKTHFASKIEEWEDWNKEGRAAATTFFDEHYIYNCISNNTPRFKDFNSVEDLISRYERDIRKEFFSAQSEATRLEQKVKNNVAIETEEICYWRKHADLNLYFTKIAEKRLKFSGDFNGETLLLTKQDIIDLKEKLELRKKDKYVFETGVGFFWGSSTEEDWEDTLDEIDELLEMFDFENETLYYCCSF